MSHHETPLASRNFGTLAYDYDQQVLRYEDAVHGLARLEKEHRNLSALTGERDDAVAQARLIRAALIDKLRDLDRRMGFAALPH